MDVLMPQLGETVAEGKIVKWFKQAGDAVKPGENLFEIETDKTSMEVPSIAAGTLTDIRLGVGEVAKVGAVVAIIAGAGDAAQAKAPDTKPADARPVQQTPLTPAKAGVQSPAKKELDPRFRGDNRGAGRGDERGNTSAQSRDFAYTDMSPWREVRTPERNYGPARIGGRHVTPLARRLASERGIDLTRVAGSGPHGRIVATDIDKTPRHEIASPRGSSFYLVADVDIGRLQAMLTEAKSAGAELSIGDFAIKAWAVALRRVTPDAGGDIGLIQNADGRRVTKVIRDAATKPLTGIAQDARDQAGDVPDARATSAVHILAASGIREFTDVIAPPFTSVLAIGQPRRAPIENDDGGIKFIGLMTVTLSCDHAVVDTALAAELVTTFKSLVENPVAALV